MSAGVSAQCTVHRPPPSMGMGHEVWGMRTTPGPGASCWSDARSIDDEGGRRPVHCALCTDYFLSHASLLPPSHALRNSAAARAGSFAVPRPSETIRPRLKQAGISLASHIC